MNMGKMVLFDIDRTLFNTEVFKRSNLRTHKLYKEVLDVLEELAKIATLGIFSEGEKDLQTAKLLKTDIHRHFPQEYVHIVKSKGGMLEEVLAKYRDFTLYLVDDKLPLLYEAKKILPSLFTIWVKRGKYARKQRPIVGFHPDATVLNLRGIIRLVREN